MKECVVVVDDDVDILKTAKLLLAPYFDVEVLTSPIGIKKLFQARQVDAVILDMNFTPGSVDCKEGLSCLKQILSINSEVVVIMNTAFGDIDVAVEAMKIGAADFIVKPWNTETLLKKIKGALKKKQPDGERDLTQKKIKEDNFLFESTSITMQPILNYIHKVAPTTASVLLLGENGTGKTLLAYKIHCLSGRSTGPFIKVDLGAIPETLFESELFGHVKGAFTDAKDHKTGKFELANGGTLFLDEISNLSFKLQSKLLSAIQFKSFSRIGSNKPIRTDIRLICASNQDIYRLSEINEFRQDLLYRINTFEITLPPLRERKEDISTFSDFFLNEFSEVYTKPGLQFSAQAKKLLQQHSWPGNIRELRHTIERAVILCEGKLIKPEFVLLSQSSSAVETRPEKNTTSWTDLEKDAIVEALRKANGNLSQAARDLGLGRATMYRKMQKLNIRK